MRAAEYRTNRRLITRAVPTATAHEASNISSSSDNWAAPARMTNDAAKPSHELIGDWVTATP